MLLCCLKYVAHRCFLDTLFGIGFPVSLQQQLLGVCYRIAYEGHHSQHATGRAMRNLAAKGIFVYFGIKIIHANFRNCIKKCNICRKVFSLANKGRSQQAKSEEEFYIACLRFLKFEETCFHASVAWPPMCILYFDQIVAYSIGISCWIWLCLCVNCLLQIPAGTSLMFECTTYKIAVYHIYRNISGITLTVVNSLRDVIQELHADPFYHTDFNFSKTTTAGISCICCMHTASHMYVSVCVHWATDTWKTSVKWHCTWNQHLHCVTSV